MAPISSHCERLSLSMSTRSCGTDAASHTFHVCCAAGHCGRRDPARAAHEAPHGVRDGAAGLASQRRKELKKAVDDASAADALAAVWETRVLATFKQ